MKEMLKVTKTRSGNGSREDKKKCFIRTNITVSSDLSRQLDIVIESVFYYCSLFMFVYIYSYF